jgi:hypothetical protein
MLQVLVVKFAFTCFSLQQKQYYRKDNHKRFDNRNDCESFLEPRVLCLPAATGHASGKGVFYCGSPFMFNI